MPRSHSRARSSAGCMDPCTAARAQQLEVSGCFPPSPDPIAAVPAALQSAAGCQQPLWKAGRGCSITDAAKLVEQWKPSHNSHRAQPFYRDIGSSQGPGQSLYVPPSPHRNRGILNPFIDTLAEHRSATTRCCQDRKL